MCLRRVGAGFTLLHADASSRPFSLYVPKMHVIRPCCDAHREPYTIDGVGNIVELLGITAAEFYLGALARSEPSHVVAEHSSRVCQFTYSWPAPGSSDTLMF